MATPRNRTARVVLWTTVLSSGYAAGWLLQRFVAPGLLRTTLGVVVVSMGIFVLELGRAYLGGEREGNSQGVGS
jgi:hypothetical protein